MIEYTGEVVVLVGVILEDRAESLKDKHPLEAVIIERSDESQTEVSLSTKSDDAPRKKAVRRATKVLLVGLLMAIVGIIRANQISDERIAALNAEAGERGKRQIAYQ